MVIKKKIKSVKKKEVKIKKKGNEKKEIKKKVDKKKENHVKREVLVGVVSNYFEHVGAASIKLKIGLKKGDRIHVVGGNVDFNQTVGSMQIKHKFITEAKIGNDVGIKLDQKVRKGYKIFKK
jgi:putative protease